jgi:hypothetical protein
MGRKKHEPDAEIARIYDEVKCGYIHFSYGFIPSRSGMKETPLLIECWNLTCGPQHGCEYLEKGECGHRSEEIKRKNLYDPDKRFGMRMHK